MRTRSLSTVQQTHTQDPSVEIKEEVKHEVDVDQEHPIDAGLSTRQIQFHRVVYKQVREIPPRYLSTYGDIAKSLGLPNYSRHVGFALGAVKAGSNVPWWRVINSKGQVSYRSGDIIGEGSRSSPFKSRQQLLLEKEGHLFQASGTIKGWHRRLHKF